jgi:hypothetical protein
MKTEEEPSSESLFFKLDEGQNPALDFVSGCLQLQIVWSSVVEKSFVFESNIVNVPKPAVSFCGCQASNKEVDSGDLIDFVKEVTTYAGDTSEMYKRRHSSTLSEGLRVHLID